MKLRISNKPSEATVTFRYQYDDNANTYGKLNQQLVNQKRRRLRPSTVTSTDSRLRILNVKAQKGQRQVTRNLHNCKSNHHITKAKFSHFLLYDLSRHLLLLQLSSDTQKTTLTVPSVWHTTAPPARSVHVHFVRVRLTGLSYQYKQAFENRLASKFVTINRFTRFSNLSSHQTHMNTTLF